MNKLTDIQGKVLDFIMKEIREHSLPPTRREISKFLGLTHSASQCHMIALEKKGFIRTRTRISRGIEVKPLAWEWQETHGEAV